jgi:hypothetical protein
MSAQDRGSAKKKKVGRAGIEPKGKREIGVGKIINSRDSISEALISLRMN